MPRGIWTPVRRDPIRCSSCQRDKYSTGLLGAKDYLGAPHERMAVVGKSRKRMELADDASPAVGKTPLGWLQRGREPTERTEGGEEPTKTALIAWQECCNIDLKGCTRQCTSVLLVAAAAAQTAARRPENLPAAGVAAEELVSRLNGDAEDWNSFWLAARPNTTRRAVVDSAQLQTPRSAYRLTAEWETSHPNLQVARKGARAPKEKGSTFPSLTCGWRMFARRKQPS